MHENKKLEIKKFMRDFTINDIIKFSNKTEGKIKYIGKLKGRDGIWVGVELNKPHGKNSGMFNGEKYFNAKEDHGLFIRKDMITESIDFNDVSSLITTSTDEIDYKRAYEKEHLKRKIQETNFSEKLARMRKRRNLNAVENLDEMESATSFFVKVKYAGLLDDDHLRVIKLVRTMIAKLKENKDVSKELAEYKELLAKENIKLNV